MAGFAKAFVCGYLYSPPKLKVSKADTPYLRFTLVTSDNYEAHGKRVDERCDIPCFLFGERAYTLAKMLHKGDKCTVVGYLKAERHKASKKKTYTEFYIYVERIEGMQAEHADVKVVRDVPHQEIKML
jgi:single-stranded DNA-binding protein